MAALENEVLRNPKPSLVDRSVLELSADKLVPPDIYVDRPLLRARVGYDDVCEAGGPLRGHKFHRNDSSDSDLEMVAEAKARIKELQQEAETLEEAYRSYQQRAVHSTISHMLPPRPFSPQHPSHRPDSPLRKQHSYHSHSHSAHKAQISPGPLSPQTIRSRSYDTRNTSPPAPTRVTFSEDHYRPKATVFTDHSLHTLTEPLFLRDGHPQDESLVPSKRLSSTPRSSSRNKLQTEIVEGNLIKCFILSKHFTKHKTVKPFSQRVFSNLKFLFSLEAAVSVAPFPNLPSDRQLCNAPNNEVATSGDSSSEFSPPRSPQLKSTVRDQSRYHLASS